VKIIPLRMINALPPTLNIKQN